MGWIKLDHVLLTHSKVFKAPDGFGLYCMSLLYSDYHNTDGFVEEEAIPHLIRGLKGVPRRRQQLVAAGLWQEVEGGVQIYNYLKHNRSAEQVAEIRAKRAAVGSLGGSKRASNAQANAKQFASTSPSKPQAAWFDTVQAEKSREEESREEEALQAPSLPAEDDLDFETFWADYPSQNWPVVPNPKPGKQQAREQWHKLTDSEKARAIASLPHYRAYLELNDQQTKHCLRYLRDRLFDGYQVSPTPRARPSPGRNARNFEAVIQRMGATDGQDASTADRQVPQRGLAEGRMEPGAIRALG